MKHGVFIFATDLAIDPVSLARAAEERGFALGQRGLLLWRIHLEPRCVAGDAVGHERRDRIVEERLVVGESPE